MAQSMETVFFCVNYWCITSRLIADRYSTVRHPIRFLSGVLVRGNYYYTVRTILDYVGARRPAASSLTSEVGVQYLFLKFKTILYRIRIFFCKRSSTLYVDVGTKCILKF